MITSRIWAAILGAALFLTAAASGASETAVLYLVDLSASMEEPIGLSTKRELLMDALEVQLGSLPRGAEVAIRSFGGAVASAESCSDTRLVSRFGEPPDIRALRALTGAGKTPLALAISRAAEDFQMARSRGRRIVVVTDGFDSCGGDPAVAIAEQRAKGVDIELQIVGFVSAREASLQLASLARSSRGSFRRAVDGEDLVRAVAAAARGENMENRGDLGSGIDAGSSPRAALDLSPGSFAENSLGAGDESDLYRIPAEKGDKVQVEVRSASGLHVEILDPSRRTISEKHGSFVEILLESDRGGPYYLRISTSNSENQGYQIKLDRLVSYGKAAL